MINIAVWCNLMQLARFSGSVRRERLTATSKNNRPWDSVSATNLSLEIEGVGKKTKPVFCIILHVLWLSSLLRSIVRNILGCLVPKRTIFVLSLVHSGCHCVPPPGPFSRLAFCTNKPHTNHRQNVRKLKNLYKHSLFLAVHRTCFWCRSGTEFSPSDSESDGQRAKCHLKRPAGIEQKDIPYSKILQEHPLSQRPFYVYNRLGSHVRHQNNVL